VVKLAVTELPGSGSPEELRAWAKIDADAIVETVREALGRR
jgi:transketolase